MLCLVRKLYNSKCLYVMCLFNWNMLLLSLFGEYLAAGSNPGAISLRKTKPR